MAKKFAASDIGWGALILAGTGATGAAIGAVVGPPCPTDGTEFLCGPAWNAAMGWAVGTLVAGVGGVAVAAVSEKHRNIGLGTASAAGILMTVGLIRVALMSKSTAPAVTQAPNTVQLPPTPNTATPHA
jgi:hypothetical protein